jgi:hypothetical protein
MGLDVQEGQTVSVLVSSLKPSVKRSACVKCDQLVGFSESSTSGVKDQPTTVWVSTHSQQRASRSLVLLVAPELKINQRCPSPYPKKHPHPIHTPSTSIHKRSQQPWLCVAYLKVGYDIFRAQPSTILLQMTG